MGIFQGLVISCALGVFVGWGLTKRHCIDKEQEAPVKTITIQPQPKDTTTYHFSDEFTDTQLREMVRSGHLKLR